MKWTDYLGAGERDTGFPRTAPFIPSASLRGGVLTNFCGFLCGAVGFAYASSNAPLGLSPCTF